MAAVIPDEVLRHLREVASQRDDPLQGGFTQAQMAEAMSVPTARARELLREMVRAGTIYSRRVGINQEQAQELGMLSGCSIPVYYLTED